MRTGAALVISAPSGGGKSTLSRMLLREFPNLGYSVSCTTRKPRKGEEDGVHYHFLGEDEFVARRDAGAFAEWAQVHGNYYGTLLDPLRRLLDSGRDVLFDIDAQGAKQLKKRLPGAAFAFILPPSMEELEKRLRARGLDSEETIQKRLADAEWEISQIPHYDALIVNGELDAAYADLRAFYIAATLAPQRRLKFIEGFLGRKADHASR